MMSWSKATDLPPNPDFVQSACRSARVESRWPLCGTPCLGREEGCGAAKAPDGACGVYVPFERCSRVRQWSLRAQCASPLMPRTLQQKPHFALSMRSRISEEHFSA